MFYRLFRPGQTANPSQPLISFASARYSYRVIVEAKSSEKEGIDC